MKLDKSKLASVSLIGVAVAGPMLWGDVAGKTGTSAPETALAGAPNAPIASAEPVESAKDIVMPAGTPLRIRLDSSNGTAVSRSGDRVSGTLASLAVVGDVTASPTGTSVGGVVVNSAPSGRLKGHAVLTLRLNSVLLAG